MTGYLLLLLLSPAFNRLIGAFTQREHKTVLIILFFVFSFLPSVFGDYLGTDGGYSLLWFTVLYFTAAYIRKYGLLFFGVIIVSVFSLYIAGLAVEWVRSSLYRRTDPCIMRFADKIKDKIGEKI